MQHDTTQLQIHLSFNGNCKEAMNFYAFCFGGKLSLLPIEQSPMSAQWPQNMQHLILHASLQHANFTLLGSDVGGAHVKTGGPISIALICETDKDLELYFESLSIKGSVTHQPHKFFDGTIAALVDQYGINWILKR